MNGCDIWVVQGGEDGRLAFEAFEAVGIFSERLGKQLDRDIATESRVGGPIDLAHAAFAQLGGDLVVCNRPSCHS